MSLPAGFRVRIHADVEWTDRGRVLVGGSPLRVVRLSRRAVAQLNGRELEVVGTTAEVLAERLMDANIAVPVLDDEFRAPASEVTVVIPVRDRSEQLERALAALDGLAVIVVDDASVDPRAVGSVAGDHGAHVIHLDHNVGPAAARNIGLRHVSTPYVAFVDCDVVVAPDTLLALTAHFADPKVTAVAPCVRSRAASPRPGWIERHDEATPALGLGERAGVVRPGAGVAWLPSACLVARAHRLTSPEIAGFDAALRVGEDVDLVWRLVAAGDRVRYDPAYEAHHESRATVRSWAARKFAYGTGGAPLAARHPGNLAAAVLSPSMGVAALALLLRRRWALPIAAAGLARGALVVERSLPRSPGRGWLAARLSLRGFGWSLRQESGLVLRHWWPVVFVLAVVSRSARRVVASAMVVDVIATRVERPELPVARSVAGRRVDDLAYGAGLWWGALRGRSVRCLAVRVVRKTTDTTTRTAHARPSPARASTSDGPYHVSSRPLTSWVGVRENASGPSEAVKA
jgi:mycofactocin system glycosyltransferase